MRHLLIAGLICASSFASAATFNESTDATGGDAGETISTAQDVTSILGAIEASDSITGAIDQGADLYRFTFSGGLFTAQTFATGTTIDTQLFLFNEDGTGIIANDDIVGQGTLQSLVTATLSAGTYLLGVSTFDNDPVTAGGDEIFPNTFRALVTPNNAGDVLASFQSPAGSTGSYTIDFSGTVAVPVPAALPLALAGLGLLLGIGRRRVSQTIA
ncbi:MAG: DVUA0089 family protein [Pseudomonadota bacterium]